MSTQSREYLSAYKIANAEKLKEQQSERDKKKKEARDASPEALAEYKAKRRAEYLKLHPQAQTMEERAAGKRPRRIIDRSENRECIDCHTRKPLEDFPRHGPLGHKAWCNACSDIRSKVSVKKSQKVYTAKNREKINRTKRIWAKAQPKPVVEKVVQVVEKKPSSYIGWKERFTRDGWRCLGGVGDGHEQIMVFIRGWIIMYIRGAKGSYSTGKTSFAVLFDDEMPRQLTLTRAEARARKLYA